MWTIRCKNVKKYFSAGDGSRVHALDGVTMDIEQGHLVVLKGRSGSGKTTLLNILSMLDMPTEGWVEFMGKNVSEISESEREQMRRCRMGFVFQSIALIPVMNAYENVEFSLRLAGYQGNRDERVREILERVGMEKRMEHMPGQLSGGEQQRIAIARAVAHHPAVIFADEPTGALDTRSGLAVMHLFRQLVTDENVTIIMTTHDPNLMELGDDIFEMKDGSI